MSKFLSGGIAAFALAASAAAIAQTPSPASQVPKAKPSRGSYFTSNQARADVPVHVERMFKELDVNHDGFVTKDEIAASQAKFEERLSKSASKRAASRFDRLDSNHDGKITKSEGGARRSRLFDEADANKDGVITRAEFDAAVASGKIKLRHANMRGAAIARLFDAADVNKDGKVSLDEAKQAALKHFDAADANHDGVLTPDERRQASKEERAKRGGG